MPDITMCSSENCPMRGSCYRSRAKPDKYRVGQILNIFVMKIVDSMNI